MLDHDGQRPEALDRVIGSLALVQVTMTGREEEAAVTRVMATLRRAAEKHVAHAIALMPEADPSDGRLLRIVEQAQEASAETSVVVHPTAGQHEQRPELAGVARTRDQAARRRSVARAASRADRDAVTWSLR
jgi:hypothetical protein